MPNKSPLKVSDRRLVPISAAVFDGQLARELFSS